MFLHLSVILFTGEGKGSLYLGGWVSVQGGRDPPSRMVEEWAVRILLECILVYYELVQNVFTFLFGLVYAQRLF